MIPLKVLQDIDDTSNPDMTTKARLESTAAENQFINGKMTAIKVRLSYVPR
jgi:mediator of RNA polymerase II transcription subunit 10